MHLEPQSPKRRVDVTQLKEAMEKSANRRSFLKTGIATGAATMGAGLVGGLSAFGQDEERGGPVTRGDIAILRFLNALEQIEADLWIQYNELGGVQAAVTAPMRSGVVPHSLDRRTEICAPPIETRTRSRTV